MSIKKWYIYVHIYLHQHVALFCIFKMLHNGHLVHFILQMSFSLSFTFSNMLLHVHLVHSSSQLPGVLYSMTATVIDFHIANISALVVSSDNKHFEGTSLCRKAQPVLLLVCFTFTLRLYSHGTLHFRSPRVWRFPTEEFSVTPAGGPTV